MSSQLTNAAMVAGEDAVLAGLRRGLGRDGIPIPAHRTLGVEVREVTAGSAVVRTARRREQLRDGARGSARAAGPRSGQ